MATKPTIALLSDFGTRDHYAGVMKGVVLSICPDAVLVDISHDLPAHDIPFAARELAATYKYFPAGTIFLVVVDPGVGSARRGIAADVGDWRFVAPDNGVLTAVLQEAPPKKVVELTERRYARPTVSRTFEGRDRFAPAAAWLAKGIQLPALGRAVSDYVQIDLAQAVLLDGEIRGEVVRVDRFGNVVTNVDRRLCEKLTGAGGTMRIEVGGRPVDRLVSTFSEIGAGDVCALFGSTDHLECAAHAASAAEVLGVGAGAVVTVRRR
ncbi:MAG: SAM-dependent chlorinase/fluorinase [Acidobacteria bacterium]|nr:SAM-dependent chlorinase/fluorinase [Acidobacteriota bacterium]